MDRRRYAHVDQGEGNKQHQGSNSIEAGKPANFIVLNAKGEFEAVCNRVSVACSVRDGEFLFERTPEVINTANSLLK
nr:hypothetical protein [uncultured Phascolarctobacterium sp.]